MSRFRDNDGAIYLSPYVADGRSSPFLFIFSTYIKRKSRKKINKSYPCDAACCGGGRNGTKVEFGVVVRQTTDFVCLFAFSVMF